MKVLKQVFAFSLLLALSITPMMAQGGNGKAKKADKKAKVENTNSSAIAPLQYRLLQVSEDRVHLQYKKQEGLPVSISIYDAEGEKLLSRRQKKYDTVRTLYDISEFPCGTYTLELIYGTEKYTLEFTRG
jgi:hypothetical protein